MIDDADRFGGGISGFGVAEERKRHSAGPAVLREPGTRAGEGEPAGEGIDTGDERPASLRPRQQRLAVSMTTTRLQRSNMAKAIGRAAPTIGEALGSGVGTHVGSGTKRSARRKLSSHSLY